MDSICLGFYVLEKKSGIPYEIIDRSMKFKDFFILFLFLAGMGSWAESALAKSKNSGLGPLELRNQYPVTQQFLSLHPENTATQKKGKSRFSYHIAVANTFVNTQGHSKQITSKEFQNKISESDFDDNDPNTSGSDDKVRGFSLYLDVETTRHTFEYRFGLSNTFEFGLDIPFLSFGGGMMDSLIESVHDTIGVSNAEYRGAFRSFSEKNQYAFYVVRDGTFLFNSEKSFNLVAAEPVLGLKWNISEGGTVLPALSLKFAYKVPNSERMGFYKLSRSGGGDWGHYLILSKGYGSWLAYFGDGLTRIQENHNMADSLKHRFMAIEYRLSKKSSILIQTVTQSSIFPKTHELRELEANQEQKNFNLVVPTNVFMGGYKLEWNQLIWEMGFAQDYANYGNETDFVIFIETGMQW